MTIKKISLFALAGTFFFYSCKEEKTKENITESIQEIENSEWRSEVYEETDEDGFRWKTERFADIKMVRYQMPNFNKLSLQQQKLVYFLTQAGYAGRDIIWDQNYRHNLKIRKVLENIYSTYNGDKTTDDWNKFVVYTKRVWFSNGIHHHYSMNKFTPSFSKEYFNTLLKKTNSELSDEILEVIFNSEIDNKKVSLDISTD